LFTAAFLFERKFSKKSGFPGHDQLIFTSSTRTMAKGFPIWKTLFGEKGFATAVKHCGKMVFWECWATGSIAPCNFGDFYFHRGSTKEGVVADVYLEKGGARCVVGDWLGCGPASFVERGQSDSKRRI
jgi:hypothetical protein